MTSVRKSPNMMSTTGRIPVIAAPTPRPVMPASEIGESITRSGPNSWTRPVRTLNAVPASATSSPITKTRSSRRSSSASASLIAFPKVSSRVPTAVLAIDVLRHLGRVGERGVEREPYACLDLRPRLDLDPLQPFLVDGLDPEQPLAEAAERVALVPPQLLLVARAVVRPVDVADVVAVVPVGVREQERGTVAAAGALDEPGRDRVHGAHVLPVDVDGVDAEGARPVEDVAGGRLEVVRVLVVEVVLADVDHGELPERGHVHRLVEQPLSERSLAEEADRHLVGAAPLRAERRPGRDPGRAADDRVRAQVPVREVRDVHRPALALVVAGRLAEQFGEHEVDARALREAVAVPAMRRGDVVVLAKRRADADRDALLADVEVREAGHLRAAVEIVHLLLEEADPRHRAVHLERELGADVRLGSRRAHAASFERTLRVRDAARSQPPRPS